MGHSQSSNPQNAAGRSNHSNFDGKNTEMSGRLQIRATCNHTQEGKDLLKFKVGDVMEVLEEHKDWWYVVHLKKKKKGYVPRFQAIINDGRPTNSTAWRKINRRQANQLLMMMGCPPGTYIIRPCSDTKNFALSVRYHDPRTNSWSVKHYKVIVTADGEFQLRNIVLSNVDDLIKCCENTRILCCLLSNICPSEPPAVQFVDLEVNHRDIVMYQRLGSGHFGEVWLGVWSRAMEVAVKKLKPASMDPYDFQQEAKLMHRSRHPRVVTVLGVCMAREPQLILMEYLENGNLVEYLRADRGRRVTFQDQIRMMGEIAEGMVHLESFLIVHRDLRAANILVTTDRHVKINDFTLARVTVNGLYSSSGTMKSPIRWTAPEVMIHQRFSFKSDVWSFGVVMMEIITYGERPYNDMSNDAIKNEVRSGYRIPNPSEDGKTFCPNELYAIIVQCWDVKPVKRPGFSQLQSICEGWYFR